MTVRTPPLPGAAPCLRDVRLNEGVRSVSLRKYRAKRQRDLQVGRNPPPRNMATEMV